MSKILLAEDDANLREIFEMRLKSEGYEVVTAGDGEEALVVATREHPDLMVVDIMMPKISGFEMLETLRANPATANIKAIMMTALGQAEDRQRGESLGVLKYLVKSQVTLEDFVRSIREALSPNQANKQQRSNNMDDPAAQQNTNPMDPAMGTPAPDAATPATPAMPDAPAADPATTPAPMPDAQTTTDEAAGVQAQVNDFASQPAPDAATPATPAMPDAPAADPAAATPQMPQSSEPEVTPTPGETVEPTNSTEQTQ